MDCLKDEDGWRNLKELRKNRLFGNRKLGLEFLIGFGKREGYFWESCQFCLGDLRLMCDLQCESSRSVKDPLELYAY